MRWAVHGEREIYGSDWVRLTLVDVEIPDGRRFEHHVIRAPHDAAGVVIHDSDLGVLLIWRHRFITDTWGWEIPAGAAGDGEPIEAAAAREVVEETGWRVSSLERLIAYHPMNGISDQQFHAFLANGAEHVGEPTDRAEAERIEWVPVAEVRRAMRSGLMRDGLSLAAMSYALAFRELDQVPNSQHRGQRP